MALRCFLFSSEEGTSDVIRQVLTGLGVEGESCAEASTAIEKVSKESFQLVVIDWDQQPEGGMLLSAARERKAAERPLTLAIVSDDASVPKALQAGANSVLRRPLILNQVKDTLTTAHDLIRSRQESTDRTKAAAAAASPGGATGLLSKEESPKENPLRHGEFLQSTPVAPSRQYETEPEQQSASADIDPLKDLEPMASAVPAQPAQIAPPPYESDEPRGLEYYLKTRGGRQTSAAAPAPAPVPAPSSKPELLGFDQTPAYSAPPKEAEHREEARRPEPAQPSAQERKKEAELFAYIDGGAGEPKKGTRFGLGKGAIVAATVLAACAIIAAPQAPWHSRLLTVIGRGQKTLHAWLNPQPVITPQAPASHENFGRAGDEYKLPVAENIPDATTDPSQISVVPVVDPTAKKPAGDNAPPDQTVSTPDATSTAPTDPAQNPAVQVQTTQPVQTTPEVAVGISAPPATTVAPPQSVTPDTETPVVAAPPVSKPAVRQPTTYVPTTKVPSSLKSQIVTMVPDASGDKPPEAALPSIEPVQVPELTERALLADQPPMPYPSNAGGRTGTVILQVLIARDGSVQDAKFMQGSLAFARTAIDGVKLWKFKPYNMNGRPVSVQTNLTIKFQPVQ